MTKIDDLPVKFEVQLAKFFAFFLDALGDLLAFFRVERGDGRLQSSMKSLVSVACPVQ